MMKGRDRGTVFVVIPESERGQQPGETLDSHEVSFSSPHFHPHPVEEFDVCGVLDDVPQVDGIQELRHRSHFHSSCFKETKKSHGGKGVGQNLAVSSSKNLYPMIWAALLIG